MPYREALTLVAGRLRGYLGRRMINLPDEVEDLLQETSLAMQLQRSTYDPTLPVTAWAIAIARHKLVGLWRRQGRCDALHNPLDGVDEMTLAVDAEAAR